VATSRWLGADVVDAVKGEALVVAAAHGSFEALDCRSLVVELEGLVGGDLGAVELMVGGGVDEEQFAGFSRAREGGV
jgi:hypothetical protein